jgi:hypothetical protein
LSRECDAECVGIDRKTKWRIKTIGLSHLFIYMIKEMKSLKGSTSEKEQYLTGERFKFQHGYR